MRNGLMNRAERERLKALVDRKRRGVVGETDKAHRSLMRDIDRLCKQAQKAVINDAQSHEEVRAGREPENSENEEGSGGQEERPLLCV
jgi:hypothetical protein